MKTSFGDLLFKSWVVGMLVFSASRYAGIFQSVFEMKMVFSSWVLVLLLAGICLEFTLLSIPLCVGLFLRRLWARKLWLVVLFFSLFHPLDTYWQYGPFSPENSPFRLLAHFIAIALLLAFCMSRPFARYMDRQGGRAWFRIALTVCVLGTIVSRGAFAWWNFTVPKVSCERIDLPTNAMKNPMPDGWMEAEAYGYVIPAPISSTNDHRVFEDGTEWHAFLEKMGEETHRYALIMQEIPSYRYFPKKAGITDLEKAYRIRYEHGSCLIAQTMRVLEPNFSHVGFQSEDGVDMMYRLWPAEDDRDFIEVGLEDGKTYHKLILQSKTPLTLEEKLRLVAVVKLKRLSD